ncbi:MAG: hypothetical protein RL033_1157 [Pseudomonadota bacterium]
MFKGSSTCAIDANAKCCYSCPLTPPPGCPVDPACTADPASVNRLTPELDGQNLRCYQQKRRFGVDFLYPTQRYVNALTQLELCWNKLDLSTADCPRDDLRPNPLFEGGRAQSLVFLGGIIGVPWQALASDVDTNGRPVTAGFLRFKTYAELTRDDVWAQILGSPGVAWQPAAGSQPEVLSTPSTPPTLPQMVETPTLRPNIAAGNAINGRDYDTTQGTVTQQGGGARADDLQYACILPLAAPRDCSLLDPLVDNCDCFTGVNDRPLCEQAPGVSAAGNTQYWAKAFPGPRELQVLRDFGAVTSNSIVASICTRNVTGITEPDYGYRPAVASIVERVKEQLGARCLPRPLAVEDDGTVACTLVETLPRRQRDPLTGAQLACPPCQAQLGRKVLEPALDAAVRGQLALAPDRPCNPGDPSCSEACSCELQQVQQVQGVDGAAALRSCQQDADPGGIEGWCYIDPTRGIGSSELTRNCPANEPRRIRFLGQAPAAGATLLTLCPDPSP